jgi:hypothetical protein
MADNQKAVRLAGRTLECGCHACAFFHTREEEYQIFAPFFEEGVKQGDRSFQVVNPSHRAERIRRLGEGGTDVEAMLAKGQVEIHNWGEAYLREDRFDQDAMLTLIEDTLREGKKQGYPLTRLWANMEWGLEDFPGVDDIVEYETRLNHVLPKYDDIVVCTYDLNKFSAGVVMDIMRTHPHVIVGGILQENPFFVPPDQFLEEIRAR